MNEEVRKAAEAFLAAGLAYKEATRKAKMDLGAVLWFEAPEGMVIITRGEYKHVLTKNIPEVGRVYSLGGTLNEPN